MESPPLIYTAQNVTQIIKRTVSSPDYEKPVNVSVIIVITIFKNYVYVAQFS